MRINCHAHIFNGTAVFTSHTLEILLKRITDLDIPALIKKELVKQLARLFKKAGPYVDEESLFRNVVQKVSASAEFNNLLNSLSPGDALRMDMSGGAVLEDYAVAGLVTLLGKIGASLDKENKDARKADILDTLCFLRIILLPDIRHVTDELMQQLTLQDAVVALTMDITDDGSHAKLFEKQLAATSAQVLAYPGRIFPFVAVNTCRPEHFNIMETALNGRGFVGVKLYPSLGFAIDSPEMYKVYTYCEDRGIPLLMHCNEGGFYYSNETRKNSDPSLWGQILKRHPQLKICFGHFGGAEYLCSPHLPDPCWSRKILDLMESYAGVYADISSHSAPMAGGDVEKHYFANISKLLDNGIYRRRILFGTDFFLVRHRLSEKNYWKYFRSQLPEEQFRQICEINPSEFLGLPTAEHPAGLPIQNYVRFIYQNRNALLSKAPGWLNSEIQTLYGPSAKLPKPSLGPLWSWNNKVHAFLYVFLAEGQLGERQKKRGFEVAGLFKLRDMAYWNKGFETRQIWEKKLTAMAENLDTFLRTNGGSYEKGQNAKKAISHLVELLDSGSRYIHEVGEGCDAIYTFE